MNVKDSLYQVNQSIGNAQGCLNQAKEMQTKLQRHFWDDNAIKDYDAFNEVYSEICTSKACSTDKHTISYLTSAVEKLLAIVKERK